VVHAESIQEKFIGSNEFVGHLFLPPVDQHYQSSHSPRRQVVELVRVQLAKLTNAAGNLTPNPFPEREGEPDGERGERRNSYHLLWFLGGPTTKGSFVPSKVVFTESECLSISGRVWRACGICPYSIRSRLNRARSGGIVHPQPRFRTHRNLSSGPASRRVTIRGCPRARHWR
jgi:hypothetical protein